MKSEMDSIYANDTWELVPLPANKKALPCKWVFRYKYVSGTDKPKYKARLVAKGFKQEQGVDYDEIFSPVVKMTTLRYLLGVVAANDLELEQMDVKTAFLHGDLHEDIYMSQPAGFTATGGDHLVFRLMKSLYGLKQAPRMWYEKFDSHIQQLGYRWSNSDPCLYVKRGNDEKSLIYLILYVDDMLIAGKDGAAIAELKRKLHDNLSCDQTAQYK